MNYRVGAVATARCTGCDDSDVTANILCEVNTRMRTTTVTVAFDPNPANCICWKASAKVNHAMTSLLLSNVLPELHRRTGQRS